MTTFRDVGMGVASAVAFVSKQVPVFEKVYNILNAINEAVEQVKTNKEGCKIASIWALSIRDTLKCAAPFLDPKKMVNIERLLEAILKTGDRLLEMIKSYKESHYIVKLFKTYTFKKQFTACQTNASYLLEALNLNMSALHLAELKSANEMSRATGKAQVNGQSSHKLLELKNIEKRIKESLEKTKDLFMPVDKKLDQIMETQHTMYTEIKKNQAIHGRTEQKIDWLLDLVNKMKPGQRAFTVCVDAELSAEMLLPFDSTKKAFNFRNIAQIRPISRPRTLTPSWKVAKNTFETMDIFCEREWDWLKRYLGECLYCFDFEPVQQSAKHLALIQAEEKLPNILQTRLEMAAKNLKCEERGVKFRLGKCASFQTTIRFPIAIEFTVKRTGAMNARDFRNLALPHKKWKTLREEKRGILDIPLFPTF